MKIISFATLLSAQTSKFIARHKDDEVFVVSPLDDEVLFNAIKNHHFFSSNQSVLTVQRKMLICVACAML